jgi:hypothetical protein
MPPFALQLHTAFRHGRAERDHQLRMLSLQHQYAEEEAHARLQQLARPPTMQALPAPSSGSPWAQSAPTALPPTPPPAAGPSLEDVQNTINMLPELTGEVKETLARLLAGLFKDKQR